MKIAILGSDGFVGKNIYEDLRGLFTCYASTRSSRDLPSEGPSFFLDITEPASWETLSVIRPDCIINCIGYGVIKTQTDVKQMVDINYLHTARFYDYLGKHLPGAYLIHIGTAFEYNLAERELTEQSECTPKTYYGISKQLISHYLLSGGMVKEYTIVRPFNMFGPYESDTKIIPLLIRSQRMRSPVALSGGSQQRDYFFVKDLSKLIIGLMEDPGKRRKIVNAGSGRPLSLKELAAMTSRHIEGFEAHWWEWGKVPYREGESELFFNNSTIALECGLTLTALDKALELTVKYYWNV